MKFRIVMLCICFNLLYQFSFAQNSSLAPLLTADSVASGSSKDVFSSFLQLAANNITGSNKEFHFKSNPFSLMLKANPDLAMDKNYLKYKTLRNLNFDFDIKLDSNFHFNGFGAGITYALINRRDYTVYDKFIDLVYLKNGDYHRLHEGIIQQSSAKSIDPAFRVRLIKEQHDLFNDADTTFDMLDKDVRDFILKVAKDSSFNTLVDSISSNSKMSFRNAIDKAYNGVKASFQNKHLLTVGIADTTYSNAFFFKNLVFNAESIKGILNPNNTTANVQWDWKISDMLYTDSTKSDRNLKRHVLSFEPGFNLVIKNKSTQQSLLEFKLSGEYNHIFNGVYTGEKRDSSTINGTLRIRILDDLWVPLEIKYDPRHGNVFGFLNIRYNFTGLSKKFQSLSQE